jgi:hypothetical protein
MKKNCFMPLVVLILLWGSCKDVNVVEKLVFTEADIKKCECPDKKTICYYDTVKTLMVLKDVIGVIRKNYFDTTKVGGIFLENAASYITGPKEFREPFYFWWVQNGYLIPCNLPEEIISNQKYVNRKIRFSCSVDVFPLPDIGHSYPQTGAYPISLLKLEILDN